MLHQHPALVTYASHSTVLYARMSDTLATNTVAALDSDYGKNNAFVGELISKYIFKTHIAIFWGP